MSITKDSRPGPDPLLVPVRKALLSFGILLALRGEDAHGYAIARRLSAFFGGAVPEGTLYPLLKKLNGADLIAARWDTSGVGAARKVYSLTPDGRARLDTLRADWRDLMEDVKRLDHDPDN